jgi:uncharacterized protein YciI
MKPTLLRTAVAFGLLLASTACRSAPEAEPFQFAFLVRGDSTAQRTADERNATQAAHMSNIQRLAEEKKLLVAGPFGEGNPHPEARGIFLFDTAEEATALEWTNTDPAVQQRVLAMELCSIRTAPSVRRAYELDQAMRAELEARGEEPGFANTLRAYVMYFGRDAERSERGLATLRASGKVVFGGPLSGSKRANYLAVLDVETAAAASALLGERAADLGEHELVTWWSTRALLGLNARR